MSVTYSKKPGFKTTALEALNGADLSGKVAVVTGGNSGLGLETVKTLSIGGAKVYLLCRNPKAGEEALESIKSDQLKGEVVVEKVDTTDYDTINSFISKFLSTEKRLDFVVLNAGVMACPFERVKYGFEKQIGTNYFGHYYFVQKFLPFLKKQESESRIVLLSSVGHMFADVDLDDINYQKRKYSAWQSYGQSKTAMILQARQLGKQLQGTKVLAFSVHPGAILTNLQRYMTSGSQWLDSILLGGLNNVLLFAGLFKTISQGSATTIYACVAKDLEDKSGEYLEDCHVTKSAKYASDMDKAQRLVKLTDELLDQVEQNGKIN